MDEGEASTHFFLRKHGIEEWVFSILNPEGVLVSDMSGICHSWMTFFSMLLTACPTDSSVQGEVLGNVSSRQPPGSGSSCDGLLLVAEVRKALNGAATGKSPGSDGFCVEFYSRFWHILGEDFVEDLNTSYQSSMLPPSLRHALVALIFIKGERSDPKNWRPLFSLNCG